MRTTSASQPLSGERVTALLRASPQQLAAVDRILAGSTDPHLPRPSGPLLFGMAAAAEFVGLSRSTLWRLIRAGKLTPIEILPGTFRLRRSDLEVLAE